MIARPEYLNKLIDFKDTHLIKIVTGIRRSGKSTLFELYQDYLRQCGISDERIIAINFEDLAYFELLDYMKLYQYIKERLVPNQKNYIFLDEIQMVPEFQRVVDSLYIQKNVDLYITGSNAYLLSGEIATLLSGRYIEISIMPLSFKEYVSTYPDDTDLARKFVDYQINSSFPGAIELKTKAKIKEYLAGIYHTIVLKDIVERNKIQDVLVLEDVIKYMFDNIGNLCSSRKIANAMTSSGRKISYNTIESYLQYLVNSFVLYKANRYDVKGKQLLTSGSKYYVSDMGLRNYLLGEKPMDRGHVLENIIYLELLRRGNRVYVGKVDAQEVDFIAIHDAPTDIEDQGYAYYQVAYTVRDEATLQRELASLNQINNHYPKYLITMDDDPEVSYNGIKQINALNWLLNK